MDPELGKSTPQSESTNFARLHIWQVQAFRDVLVIAVIFGAIWAGYALRFVTVPLLLAFTLAYLVEPLVAWLCRVLRLSRSVAVSAILGTFGLGVVLAGLLFIPTLVHQTSEFVASARAGRFDLWISRFADILPAEYRNEVTRVRHWIDDKSVVSSTPLNSTLGTTVDPIVTTKPDANGDRPQVTADATSPTSETLSQTLLSPTAQSALWKLLDFSSLLFAAVLIPFYFWFFSVFAFLERFIGL